ncbi:hypothetical protein [Stigmatella aurantiaca]|uniref:Lipoprotein n=1 Tax=Stigmatella aurantiaca (strain DW4/3-1) TaxID=378806 RepID=E3FIL1_STIAD|nr:hypothetical protein [Stigmatella aurantiaca]ADO75358.1 uncharacterized protein STAUR_7603 [Stigmatella aurantiaca DW4/3-1]
MNARWIAWGILLIVASGCGTSRRVRLETGEGPAREYVPPSWNKAVRLHEDEFKGALAAWVLEAPLAIRSTQARWLVRTSHAEGEADTPWHVLLRKSDGGVCQASAPHQDCLSSREDVGRWTGGTG